MTYTQLVKHFGGLAKASQALGYSKQRIFAWKTIRIPSDIQMRIASETGLQADRKAREDAARIAGYINGTRKGVPA